MHIENKISSISEEYAEVEKVIVTIENENVSIWSKNVVCMFI